MIQTIVVIAGGAAVVALAMRASMVVVGAIGFVSLIFWGQPDYWFAAKCCFQNKILVF